jgi:CRP/FNR family transcriptional regulator, cyclic AMP receptor protein
MGLFKSTKSEVEDVLENVPLFSECSKRELSLLAGMVEEEEFDAGKDLCKEGDEGLGLSVIMEGEVAISIGGQHRRDMGVGTFFGEIALLDGGPRTATVTAKVPTRVVSIPAWTFNATLESNPELALKMLRDVCRRWRESDAAKG